MSTELQTLLRLKQRVYRDPRMRSHISEQQVTADTASDDLAQFWFKKMRKIFQQIDDYAKWVVPFANAERDFRFLDLGCCPGGFSSYILAKNKISTGVGVSLDPKSGGHAYLIDETVQDRHTILFRDITKLRVAEPAVTRISDGLVDLPDELTRREYDLIILDGHQLRNQKDKEALLVISQIIIMLKTTKAAGSTVVMKLSNAETTSTKRLLFMLDMLSADKPRSLMAYKPYKMHREKATFYAIAKGVGGGKRQQHQAYYLKHFEELWKKMLERRSSGREFRSDDLAFIASEDELELFGQKHQELCADVWKVQSEALLSRFASFETTYPKDL
ncbi:hypothetical protein CYLTODRAFT_396708 [Cylindrobasidium torrendii FP15055 ss-10]|uniref:Ribosomal RNA methyltransferase FtsJ domain-containing protein n=1 Tax=Cylindrobasidium torrendii FP15055 ss-10 TaxID=1314674 RepID=A0A0D7BAS2_9AGAR|nr:hypothetical protein CYLTODRAFT_396708 [Cylindrobasidium torrendii FP15055 ss-10]